MSSGGSPSVVQPFGEIGTLGRRHVSFILTHIEHLQYRMNRERERLSMWLPANIVRGEVRVTHRALAAGHFCKAVPGQLKICWLVNMNRSSLEISIY